MEEKRVIVIGGGISGLTAALSAAELGKKVMLIEKAPSIGGMLERLDTWFIDDACGMCQILSQFSNHEKLDRCLRRDFFHPNIEVVTLAQIVAMEQDEDGMLLTVKRDPRYVDEIKCTACRLCEEVCPEEGPDPFDRGFTKHKAIHTLYAGNLTKTYYIDKALCTECGKCVEVCPTHAIDLKQIATEDKVRASSIIVATGFTDIDPTTLSSFGYGKYQNVLTSLDFERLISRSGAHPESLARPSDGKTPGSVALIQCVGSRDKEREYCSSACCMYAVKEARKIKELSPNTDVSIFYMDLRAFGKGHYRYVLDAEQMGVKLKNFRIPSVIEDENGALEIAYESEGKMMKEKYDLVILSTGQELTAETKALLALLNIEMDTYGFAATQAFEQYQTKTPGILIAGSVAEPKDIETAIIEARAAGFISDAAIPELKTPEGMAKDIDYRISKFGIFVCQCGGAMQKTVDTTKVVSAFVNAPDVAICEEIDLVCQEERLETIMKKVLQNGITRIIFATCSPAKYEVLIRKTAAQYGFNQAMIEVLSLREHIAWAFDHGAEEESIRRIRALMELLRLALPEGESQLKGLGNAIVIGGGIAGMVAAKQLSTRGVTVHLIEKADELGGNARNLFATLEGADVNNYLRALKDEIVNSKNITIHNNSEVVSLSGAAGAFVVGMGKGDESRSIAAGAIIVATGASEYKPKEYLFGTHERIVTQTQFEQLLASGDTKKFPASVIMIQCVGSRNSDHPWCSRVCCSDAIKNALLLKEKNPGAEIAVLYRDMMTYGKKELKFKEAREKGINFIRFRENDEPRISIDKANIVVKANDLILNRELKFEPDMVVLSAGVVPHNNLQLAAVLGVTLDEDGFFKGANPKFRPLESEKPGIFFAGLCRTPSSMGDCVTEATAAAGVAYTFLQERALVQRRAISEVIERWCAGCEFCVEVCPFDARYLDDEKKVVKVRVINCVGCGNCVSVCPSGAAKLRGLRDRQMLGVIDLSI